MSNDDQVQLDLNHPDFQSKLFVLDVLEVKKLFKTFIQKTFRNDLVRGLSKPRVKMGGA